MNRAAGFSSLKLLVIHFTKKLKVLRYSKIGAFNQAHCRYLCIISIHLITSNSFYWTIKMIAGHVKCNPSLSSFAMRSAQQNTRPTFVNTHKHSFVRHTKTLNHARIAHFVPFASASSSNSSSLNLFSPAKINIFLRIVRRREDGFHDLASLFHVIDLGDDMTFTLLPPGSTSDQLTCNFPDVPTDESNLVIKALNLFRRKHYIISKRIFIRMRCKFCGFYNGRIINQNSY